MQVEKKSIEQLIMLETNRLSEKYGKVFFNCKEIIELTGLGRDTVRTLIKESVIPSVRAGRKRIVSIVGFVNWQLNNMEK